ncbi:hypothetical protein MHB43_06490 [Paenibacillus sp. FSL H8-0317]|uniref:hypothetical protein n=1 Tax=unclassified Paenibacillus TaxID=185978 RepID=UPI0030D058A9
MSDFRILGYHGTFSEVIEYISEEGFSTVNRNNHWLGQGVYFYDDPKLAHWFITKNSESDFRKKGKGTKLALITAEITSQLDLVLDLDSIDGVDKFYSGIYELRDHLKTVGFSSDEHRNRCFILDLLVSIYGFQVVIKTFEHTDRSPSYSSVDTKRFNSEIFKLNVHYKERQICVTSDSCIKIVSVEYPSDKYPIKPKIKFDWR